MRLALKRNVDLLGTVKQKLPFLFHARDLTTSPSILMTNQSVKLNPIIYCSKGFERLSGYKKEEIYGKNPNFLQGERSSESAIQMFRYLLRNQMNGTIHIANYKKSGKQFWNRVQLWHIPETVRSPAICIASLGESS